MSLLGPASFHLTNPFFVFFSSCSTPIRRGKQVLSFFTPSAMARSSSITTDLSPYVEHVKLCNRGTPEERSKFVPFLVDNSTVGFIHPSFLQHLLSFPKVYVVMNAAQDYQNRNITDSNLNTQSFVTLHNDLKTPEDRTMSVNNSLRVLCENGLIPGWRNEMYPVTSAFRSPPFFSIERAAVPYFGIKAYGVHINGFVVDSKGKKWLWVAKRSMNKQTYPGMRDHIVAGGQPVGLSCLENVIKECNEEANIPEIIARRAVPVGAVSYEDIDGNRLKRDVLFCYDLELPLDFKPHNKDGEVETFTLLRVEEVEEILQTSMGYKPNCTLVIIDFLFRHGYITPDQDGYLPLMFSLRRGECL